MHCCYLAKWKLDQLYNFRLVFLLVVVAVVVLLPAEETIDPVKNVSDD